MRCILIDDEPLALELLEDNIGKIDFLELKASCSSAAEAMQVLQQQPIDLIFCDIQMPGINGLQLVKSLPNKPLVIFITAYQEFAMEGYELDVVDYLLKPVAFDRFLRACNKAHHIFELQKRPVALAEPRKQRRHIFLNAEYNLIKVSHQDITYIEGLKDYVKVYLISSPKPIISRITVKALEEQLPSDEFFRVHKSYMVNLEYVQSVYKGRIKLTDAEVPYTDNYREVISRMTGKLN